MGFLTIISNFNYSCASANTNVSESKTIKEAKTHSKKSKGNNWKRLANYIPTAITSGAVILSLLYYGYIIRHLNYLEKRLLNIKIQFYIMVSTVVITILAYILNVFAIIFEPETRWLLISLLVFYSLALIVITFITCKQAKNTIIVFEYNNKEYQFLHRIDNSTISALPGYVRIIGVNSK